MMAYLAFAETAGGGVAPMSAEIVAPIVWSLSPLEWSVVALARRDRMSSLREPGRFARVIDAIFGRRRNPRLADPRLEALRRIAVLSWRHGYTVASDEVRAFLAAGYTSRHYEQVVNHLNAVRSEQEAARFAR